MNGRLDTLQAAVLLAKLPLFESELARRAEIAALYDRELAGLLTIPARVPESTSAWAVYAVLFKDSETRDHAQAALREAGIASAIYYPKPLHHQPAYRGVHDGAALPVAEDIARRILALPIHPDLSDGDAARVCSVLRNTLKNSS